MSVWPIPEFERARLADALQRLYPHPSSIEPELAAEIIHGLVKSIARERINVKMIDGRFEVTNGKGSPANSLRKLWAAAKSEDLGQWKKAWQESRKEALQLLRTCRSTRVPGQPLALLGSSITRHDPKTHREVITNPDKSLDGLPLPAPWNFLEDFEWAIRTASKPGRYPNTLEDSLAAECLTVLAKLSPLPIKQPTHDPRTGLRSGHVVDFFNSINEVYAKYLVPPLVPQTSGNAYARILTLYKSRLR